MEKKPASFQSNPRRDRPVITHRSFSATSDNQPPTRIRGRGVLYAQRRSQNITITSSLFVVVIATIGCIALFLSIGGRALAARHREAPSVMAAQTLSTPEPTLIPMTGKKNILLLGSDQRAGDNGYRTDVILFISIDGDRQKVSVVSFPRDLWVRVPGIYEMKINQVLGIGGFEAVTAMFSDNFGITPDYYVLTNFEGFTSIIDNLGGIDIEIGQELTDDCDLPQAVDGDCTVYPGVSHMDGSTALWYIRSRHTSNDYDRMRRMQEVVYAVFARLMSMNAIAHAPELYEIYSSNLETNLNLPDIMPLIPMAKIVFDNPGKIDRYAINEEYAYPSMSWDGMWILIPYPDLINTLLIDAGIK